MSEPDPPAGAPPPDRSSSEAESAPFLGSEAAPDAAPTPGDSGAAPSPEAPARRGFASQAWPFLAAGALVAATLLSVYVLLHPRRSAAAEVDAGAPGTVTADQVSLQPDPNPRGAAIASLEQGQKVRVRGETARWMEVEAGGRRGFLPADAVERDADREARQKRSKTLLAFAPVYGVVAEDADVVLAPYPLAPRGGLLARGSVIAIHSVDHSYFAFADKKWGIAYVDSARVDLVPPDPRQPGVTPEKVRPLKDLTVIDLAAEPPPDEELPDLTGESAGAPAAPAPNPPLEPAPGLLEPPTVVTRVEPAYPDMARRAGVEGTVELEVSIDASGKITDVEVARGLPLGLSDAAVEAVRKWTWRPARTAAGPVASRKIVRVRFVLKAD
jgi:TonB family protein